ncbi:hypothetical protein KY306_00940 [Candidatus Woesearchaeota archaeon]|nr:hypothetical protein [Candidatus Woesearchaeota archaeon]
MEVYIAFYSKFNFNILGYGVKEWERPGLERLLPEGSFLISNDLREIQSKAACSMWSFLHGLAEKEEDYFTARIKEPGDELVKKILEEMNFPAIYFLHESDKLEFEKKFGVVAVFPGEEKWKDISWRNYVAVAWPND